jgi:hypothetical protein
MDDTQLRHRKQSESVQDDGGGAAEKAKHYLDAAEGVVPDKFKPYLVAVGPYVVQTVTFVEALIPLIHVMYDKWVVIAKILEPYRLDLLIPAFLGLVMCFFGGNYMTLIAALEAYRQIGLDSQVKLVKELQEDWVKFSAANKVDDAKDDDGDGVADVLQITPQALATRKTLLFLKTVDPSRMSHALGGLQSGMMAVIATLKLQFAKSVTLGSAIGDILLKPINKLAIPVIETSLPLEYKKWAGPSITFIVKSVAVTIAWFVARTISAYHSAIRGGNMFTSCILEYLQFMGYLKSVNLDMHPEIIGYIVAGCGLWWQLSMGFTLPFPLNIIMLPFTLLEYALMYLVNKS